MHLVNLSILLIRPTSIQLAYSLNAPNSSDAPSSSTIRLTHPHHPPVFKLATHPHHRPVFNLASKKSLNCLVLTTTSPLSELRSPIGSTNCSALNSHYNNLAHHPLLPTCLSSISDGFPLYYDSE